MHYNEWNTFVAQLPAYPAERFTGKGIIIVAGGNYLEPALVLGSRLRDLGFRHAIQIWHIGSEEIWNSSRPLLSKLKIQTRDFLDYVSESDLRPIAANVGMRRFQLKPLAILHCDLEEVLLLDADNIPVRDPTYLFSSPEYLSNSAMFWPDYWMTSLNNPIWAITGRTPIQELEQESGQLLINKGKSWEALNLCVKFNSAFYMRLLNGDKDTFRFAWKALGTPFHMIQSRPSTVGSRRQSTDLEHSICGHTMLQHDFSGRPLFVHHNQMKDLALPVGENFKYIQDQSRLPCRASPKTALHYANKSIPCFELEAPGLKFLDDKSLHVNRSHLEAFEMSYASTLRIVRLQLRPDRIRIKRRSQPQSNATFIVDESCTGDNCTEFTTNCSSNQTLFQAATNNSDTYCQNTLSNSSKYSVQLTSKSIANPLFGNGSAFGYSIERLSAVREQPDLILYASLPYQFLVDSSVPTGYELILTTTQGGGPGSNLLVTGVTGAPAGAGQTLFFQPSNDLVGTQLFYEADGAYNVGSTIEIIFSTWSQLFTDSASRFNTAFNPNVRVFQIPASGTPDLPSGGDLAGLATTCKAQCMGSNTCLGVFIFETSSRMMCYGLSDLGEPTATQLKVQCFGKVGS
jgi:hypothetical protein